MNQIFRLISDDMSLALFNTVALLEPDTDILTSKVQLTRKQYYSRIYNLTACGLIKRHHGKYYLTSLGKVVYEIKLKIERAVNNFWQLKALDSIGETNETELKDKECYSKIVNSLISDTKIKEFLITIHSNPAK